MDFIHQNNKKDIIAALATPPGMGGIAIIRVSGQGSISVVNTLVKKSIASMATHTSCVRKLYFSEKVLDQVLILVMRPPTSFTGEETVEIHCHGGHVVAKKILHALFQRTVRPADPGEFSLRAFLNGKMDLTQAEAIQDLISARNEDAAKIAEDHLEGRLSKQIRSLQKKTTDMCAILEAWVDFPEEDLEFCSFQEAIDTLSLIREEIQTLLHTFDDGKIVQEGLSLCILGAPNVGKSSLMNLLLGKERAIVSETAGTTRDLIEDDLFINGLHCRIIDTAGIRETEETIEKEGVRRSQHALSKADIIFAVLDASRPNDQEIYAPIKNLTSNKSIFIWNKIDLASQELPELSSQYTVHLSARTGEGKEALLSTLDTVVWKGRHPLKSEIMITNLRHKQALETALLSVDKVLEGLKSSLSPEFVIIDMRAILLALGSIIGTNITEDILNSIFSRFCIGK